MPRLELFLFRYRDPRTGKWIRARYRAERHDRGAVRGIRDRRGAGGSRHRSLPAALQSPRRRGRVRASSDEAQQRRAAQAIPPVVEPCSLRGVERVLLLVFLRRYVTYCARRRRFAAMNGAARLHAAVAAQVGKS